MPRVVNEDVIMRRFLLDELNLEEREQVEERFMLDRAFREKLLMAEESLIEDYLDDSLDQTDRQRFDSAFLLAAQQRENLLIARAIRERAKSETSASAFDTHLFSNLRREPVRQGMTTMRLALIAMSVATVILASIWLIYYRSQNQQRDRVLAIQTALAELNSTSHSRFEVAPAQTRSVVLSPINTRASGPISIARSHISVLELWLLPAAANSAKFKAVIIKDGTNEQFEISNLELADGPSGRAVRLRIPVQLLDSSFYQIRLSTIEESDGSSFSGEYGFQVVE